MNNQPGMCGANESESRPNEPPTCFRCKKYIYDGTILRVRGQFWHTTCLCCTVCHVQVADTCHVHNEEVYCRADFIRLFGAKCAGCTKVIAPSEAARVANGNAYHEACFSCSTCRRSLQTGEYFYVREDAKLLCYQDYKQTTGSDDSSLTDSESDESGSDESGRNRRTCMTDGQLRMLLDTYSSDRRPARARRESVSRATGLSQRDVQLWFRNRRRCEKKTQRACPQNNTDTSRLDGKQSTNSVHPQQSPFLPQQPSMTSLPFDESVTSGFQVYCPLDYMLPGAMPPNIDLSSANICNGEIVMGKPTGTGSDNKSAPVLQNNYFQENVRQWLTV